MHLNHKISILIISIIIPLKSSLGAVADSGNEVTQILNNMLEGYDKRVRPNLGGDPVNVGITMYVLSVSSISEKEMDYTMTFYFRQTWQDPRLKFKANSRTSGLKTISPGPAFVKSIWTPGTFFANEKKAFYHTDTVDNEFIRISAQGDVLRSTRVTVTATCPMDLRYFPMDRQLCPLEIESYGYTMADVIYKWAKGVESVGFSSDLSLPEFNVLGHVQKTREISLDSGNYSRLAAGTYFMRAHGYYVNEVYIPAAIITVLSWITFWMKRDATTGRAGVGMSSVFAIGLLFLHTNSAFPGISYVKIIDIYLIFSLVLVIIALLESMTVGYIEKHIKMRQNLRQRKRSDQRESDIKISESSDKLYGISPFAMESCSRILFPLSFLVFNIIYWITYLYITDIVADNLILLERK